MSFVADYGAQRTYDPVAGWDLARVAVAGGAGTQSFQLNRPDDTEIFFWGVYTRVVKTGATLPSVKPEFRVTFDIYNVDSEPSGVPPPERMKLIVDALVAYGNLHDGPVGPTQILFRGEEI
jgi:hypothetical protein